MTEARLPVYRTAMKVQTLQRRCRMDTVYIQHITAAFQAVGGAGPPPYAMMTRESVTGVLNRMFEAASQEAPDQVATVTSEDTGDLLFRLFERDRTGQVSGRSAHIALVALSADGVLGKYRSLVRLAADGSGSVSRSGLRSLLQDLSKVPAVVEEQDAIGRVEAAVSSCFAEGGDAAVSQSHLLSWLKSEPRLLLWLPTLYRLSFSQKVSHAVRCHTCETFPIAGLRYRCKKCVKVHLCQDCYLNGRQTRKHKSHHPVVEFCTQPTWRESLSSLVQNARQALLPRRHTRREGDRTKVLEWAEPGETQNRAPPTSVSTRLADSPQTCSDEESRHDASAQASPPASSKSLQTDEQPPAQQGATLLAEIRNLQRDKWLLEQQLGAWRLTVQSEQGVLEDRCSEMEVSMEMMRRHNDRLQEAMSQVAAAVEVHQALKKMEDNTENTHKGDDTLTFDPLTDSDGEEEELMKENKPQTPSPTIPHKPALSHDKHGEEPEENQPIGQPEEPEGTDLQTHVTCVSNEEVSGKCSHEDLLQEIVDRLKTDMERRRERNTGVSAQAELLEAAEQVGDSMSRLVDALRTD